MTSQEQAQSPFNPTFARLGRSVWFTLESSQRADPNRASRLEVMLDKVGDQIESIAEMSLSWIQVGDWSKRCDWNDEEWVAFLRTFQAYGGQVFMGDDTPAEEKVLFESFIVYYKFYACLPGLPKIVSESATMEAACDRVDALLATFQSRLGDPMAPCNVCGEFSLGYKLLRCSRCKRSFYCSQACQKVDWRRGHKRKCAE
jgi:hypothetical protein